MSSPSTIDPEVLRRVLAEAWPKWMTAGELSPLTGYGVRSISGLLRPKGRSSNIERGKKRIPRSGEKVMTYRLTSRDAPLLLRPLKPKPPSVRKTKSHAQINFGRLSAMGLPHETKDIDPIKSLPPPTRRAVEWLRRDGWAVWPWGLGWQVGNLMLSEQAMLDLAERRQARASS